MKRNYGYKRYNNRKYEDLNIKCNDYATIQVFEYLAKKENISKSKLLTKIIKEKYSDLYEQFSKDEDTIYALIKIMEQNREYLKEKGEDFCAQMVEYFINRLKIIKDKEEE